MNYGIIITGQSLAEGGLVDDKKIYPNIMKSQRAFMLSDYPVVRNNEQPFRLRRLKESSRVTISSSLVNTLIKNNDDTYIVSGCAIGGKAYKEIAKNGITQVYENCIKQIEYVYNKKKAKYIAIIVIHGEQDGLDNNTDYKNNLKAWQISFNNDIQRITSQRDNIRLFLCQVSSSSGYGRCGGIKSNSFPTPLQQLASIEDNNNITMVCSKYFLDYFDHSHLTNKSQILLGEYYAKAIKYEKMYNNKYEPLRPNKIVSKLNKITIEFIGVYGGLSFDNTLVKPIENNGFAYCDDTKNKILSVNITGNNKVTIILKNNIGSNAIISYAYQNGGPNTPGGLGNRGNLRDNNTDMSIYIPQYNLYNWCVIFKKYLCKSTT